MRQGFVAIALNSAFVFVSEVFSGAISDQQLAIESSFRELLDLATKGEGVMAGRGFDIQGLLAKPNLLLNIPPFLGADPHLQKADILATQEIARVRIYVECAIGQVKRRYRILNSVIPLMLSGNINQIW